MNSKTKIFSPLTVVTCAISFLFAMLFFLSLGLGAIQVLETDTATELNLLEQKQLEYVLNTNYPERTQLISPLPYDFMNDKGKTMPIATKSIMLIDVATGSIIYEKNADLEIPPASMTKLVEMYVVFEAVENGEVSLDDEVPLPPQSWARNLPSDASIMFLDANQHVTLNELLLGLAIASGNDASIAVANYVCGNMEDFVKRMNAVIADLGLTKTHFVESSGYSELNITTAREFAQFCRVYLTRFPWALEKYHSQNVLKYPLEHNLPEYQRSKGDSMAVIQYNTNKLLGKLPGCDGLKTGFIIESGYNLSLTCERYGTRFLAVMMKGPGRVSVEGNKYRVQDGTALMEYAFANFADYKVSEDKKHSFVVPVPGTKTKAVKLVPAFDETLTVPFIYGETPGGAAGSVIAKATVPDYIEFEAIEGKKYGTISYTLNGTVLREIPLVADRTTDCTKGLRKLYAIAVAQIIDVANML